MKTTKEAYKVSIVTIIGNVLLAILKLLAGILSNSGAMISDSIHTISDVGTTIIAIIGISISSKEEDENHRYGHERIECIASLLLSMILLITGIELGISGIKSLINNDYDKIPGLFALIAAVISILAKELMFQYTIRVAKKIGSSALKADAWHHRSDAISSVGALIGIILSMMGLVYFDSIASVIISLFICKVAVDIFSDATDRLVDKSCDNVKVEEIKKEVLKVKGVLGIDDIKTRIFGNKIYVDIEISADGNKTLNETHDIAEKVNNKIENKFKDIKHIMVHVNPYQERRKDE